MRSRLKLSTISFISIFLLSLNCSSAFAGFKSLFKFIKKRPTTQTSPTSPTFSRDEHEAEQDHQKNEIDREIALGAFSSLPNELIEYLMSKHLGSRSAINLSLANSLFYNVALDNKTILEKLKFPYQFEQNLQNDEDLQTIIADQSNIHFATFSPDGKHLITGTEGGSILNWNLDTQTVTKLAGLDQKLKPVTSISFSRDRKGMISIHTPPSGTKPMIVVWDSAGNLLEKREWNYQDEEIVFSFIATISPLQGTFFTYDLLGVVMPSKRRFIQRMTNVDQSGNPMTSEITTFRNPISGAPTTIFSPQLNQFTIIAREGTYPGTASVWQSHSEEHLLDISDEKYGKVQTAAYSPDGKWLLVGYESNHVSILDAKTFKELHVFQASHSDDEKRQGSLKSLAISPDKTRIVTISSKGIATLWSLSL
jgi:WD40 repeat protein